MNELKKEEIYVNESQKSNLLATIAIIVWILTIINIAFTYFIVDYKIKENEYRSFGSASNYEKALIVQKAQYDQTLWSMSIDDLKKAVWGQAGHGWHGWHEMAASPDTPLAKEDLKVETPIFGKADAKFSIYEFSDLECPYCQQLHESGVIQQAVEKNKDNLNLVFKHFPLIQIHGGAEGKAISSLCAFEASGNNSEKYYGFIESIYKVWTRASNDDIQKIIADAWIDSAKFNECVTSGKYKETVHKDLAQWTNTFGVSWTPTLIVVNNENGKWNRVASRSVESIEATMNSLK